eukprot:GHUV01049736.1.p2 GENE.GHUV01049736.1~~GHUV01049736.1.p2  ORF type:complete len:100 (-),score=14.53 GHUV01049736.1:10-309(-)
MGLNVGNKGLSITLCLGSGADQTAAVVIPQHVSIYVPGFVRLCACTYSGMSQCSTVSAHYVTLRRIQQPWSTQHKQQQTVPLYGAAAHVRGASRSVDLW